MSFLKEDLRNYCLDNKISYGDNETNFTVNVIYSFGGFVDDEPEFEIEVIIWDENDEDVVEFYDEIKVDLSEEATKEVKKAIWEAMGHLLFD